MVVMKDDTHVGQIKTEEMDEEVQNLSALE